MKKGISAIFQYILVAVVGSIILFFFIRFAIHSTESFESLNSAYVAATLKDSFTSLSVSGHLDTKFPERGWPDDVEFMLGGGANCGRIAIDDTNFISVDKIIYGPSLLKGKQFNVWTRIWKYPYKITNFFYINNKKTKYFLIYDDNSKDFVEEIDSFASEVDPEDHIPRSFNVKAISRNTINGDFVDSYSNTNDFVKLIFFNTDILALADRENVEIVKIDISDINNCRGNRKDYLCKGYVYFGTEKRNFYGKAMMYGAVFAGSLENYDCNYNRAIKNFNMIKDIYYNKASLLRQKTGCGYEALFSNIENTNMETFAENMIISNKGSNGECENVF
jgi:hypothetical protein